MDLRCAHGVKSKYPARFIETRLVLLIAGRVIILGGWAYLAHAGLGTYRLLGEGVGPRGDRRSGHTKAYPEDRLCALCTAPPLVR